MSDFLGRLAERTLGLVEPVQPRLAPLFAAGADLQLDQAETHVAPQPEWLIPSVKPAPKPAPPRAESGLTFHARRETHSPPAGREPHEIPEVMAVEEPTRGLPASERAAPPPAHHVDAVAREARSTPVVRQPEPPLLMPRSRPLAGSSAAQPMSAASPARAPAAPPTVRVTIGRVDVRAIFPPPEVRRGAPEASRPGLTLDEYVKQRREGTR